MSRLAEIPHDNATTPALVPIAPRPAATVDEVALSPMPWSGPIPDHQVTPELRQKIEALAEDYQRGGKAATDAPLIALLEKNFNRHALCVELAERVIEGGDAQGGIRYLRLALEFDRERPKTLLRLAELLDAQGNEADAAECRTMAAGARTLAELLSRAEIEIGMRRFDDAIARLEHAARIAPHNGDVFLRLGNVLLLAERFDDAALALRAAVERLPDGQKHIALFGFGQALYGSGRIGDALSLLPRALAEAGRVNSAVQALCADMVALRTQSLALADHANAHGYPVVTTGDPEEHTVTQPRYAPAHDQCHAPVAVTFPAPFVTELSDAEVIGDRGVVMNGGHVLFDGPNYRPDLEQHNIKLYTGYSHRRTDTVILVPARETLHIEQAILLCGRASGNWFHWVFEDLSRFLMIDQIADYRHLPVLVSSNVLSTGKQLLEAMCRSRQIVAMSPKARVRVDRLIVASDLAHLPDGAGTKTTERLVSAKAVDLVRSTFRPRSPSGSGPRRVFLRRPESSTRRSCVNEREIAEMLHDSGFVDVIAEDLTVDRQIDLYAGAEVIACTMGAAMTNLVWAPAGCRVLCFFKGEGRGPYLFNSVARRVGIDPVYVRGVLIENSNPTRVHSDFWMPPEHAKLGLEAVLE